MRNNFITSGSAGRRLKIAVVGSGISGLAVAHTLRDAAEITLFESGDYFGGHTHTVDVTLPTPTGPMTWGVDTGFLVFNERTYPLLLNLFAELKVDTVKSDMSFSVQVPDAVGGGPLEWNGSDLSSVFAQRGNLLNRRFYRMLWDVLRFNRICTELAIKSTQTPQDPALMQPLDAFLNHHDFSAEFKDWYLLPMLGCIWSCPTRQMLDFPVATMVRFCHNHGLIQIFNRPQWHTVTGGARCYVEKITRKLANTRLSCPVSRVERDPEGCRVYFTQNGVLHGERFDHVVLATHSDQALALLAAPSPEEQAVLGAIGYQPNTAVLHTDPSVMPHNPRAWAAWNYERSADLNQENQRVCLHYWINRLQPLPFQQPVMVSLNPTRAIDESRVLGRFRYAHPVFDEAAIAAQGRVAGLQGSGNVWFAGAWMGYGFHEDGLKAGLGVARELLKACHA